MSSVKNQGLCYLIGAGPGDPGLLTLKGKSALERADIIVYDALSSPALLHHAQADAQLIFVGKRAKNHALSQDEINELIVKETQAGKIVARLKGGDPMIFGRGGEEAAELAAAGVPFEIIPGISSTIGGVAYAGIPVTHRDHCSQLTIFTGHEDPSKAETSLDYAHLAKTPGTKVFVMGVSRLHEICTALIQGGQNPTTPMALVRWASTSQQKTLVATVATIADAADREKFSAPCVAVIGEVVNERKVISWFEKKPLFGKKIVITRTREQAGKLSEALHEAGAETIELPVIRVEKPLDRQNFADGVTHAHEYDWLIFTSPNGVEAFFDAFFATFSDARCLGNPRIAAVGPATEQKIRDYRFTVDLLPKKHVAEGLVEAFGAESIENQTFLWVRPEKTRDVLTAELSKKGAIVDECIAYRTIREERDPTGAQQLLIEQGADIITFTSASTVEHFFALEIPWPKNCVAASIGPVTTAALLAHGVKPAIEAKSHDIPGLVAAIQKWAKK